MKRKAGIEKGNGDWVKRKVENGKGERGIGV